MIVVAVIGGASAWALHGSGKDSASGAGGPGGQAAVAGQPPTVAGCRQRPLRVATTAEMAPVVSRLTHSMLTSDGCARVAVTVNTPAQVVSAIRAEDSYRPTVWIPDSTVWTNELRSAEFKLGPTLAVSPTVMAVPAALATSSTTGLQPWKTINAMPQLMAGPDVSTPTALALASAGQNGAAPIGAAAPPVGESNVVQPQEGTQPQGGKIAAGKIPAGKTQQELGKPQAQKSTTSVSSMDQLSGMILQMSRADTRSEALFTQTNSPKGQAKAFPTSEQAVQSHNATHAQGKLSAAIPSEGVAMLRYPFVRVTGTPSSALSTVDELQRLLTSSTAQAQLRSAGFRVTPTERGPGVPGVPSSLKVTPDPAVGDVTQLVNLWHRASEDSTQLWVIDVSGSMQAAAGKSTSIKLARDAARIALKGLPSSTEMGLWKFSTNLGATEDHKEIQPMRRLDARAGYTDQRALLDAGLQGLPQQTQGDTGLYDTILAAFQSANSNYNPSRVNSIVLLTDGANDDPTGGVGLDALLATLTRLRSSERPINLILIGVGDKVNLPAMQQITAAAGNQSKTFHALTPENIKQIFLEVMQVRAR
ncbi:hypothetical protein VV02_04955 [Luteipulveratus mongoliensis]|uniref:VWFA domain-containing protein n=1 Tax=Luteipulveratus mongoliensis TaxID=571913 RepID=A0A0K1JFL0_9MICO|nr:hypothetical protein VV02_04955 [Luteipulveratus mongoliensis]